MPAELETGFSSAPVHPGTSAGSSSTRTSQTKGALASSWLIASAARRRESRRVPTHTKVVAETRHPLTRAGHPGENPRTDFVVERRE